MTPLPPPIEEVTVPECFSPSALGTSRECRLRLVIASLPTTEWSERLASGPEAAVGTLLHRVLERVGRGTNASPEEIFQEEYQRAAEEIRRDPHLAHFAELASTRSLSEWTRVKSWVFARGKRQGSTRLSSEARVAGAQRIAGVEIRLQSRSLRLRGKADTIRRLGPNIFEVRDFKTGAVLNERGEIKQDVSLQLQAYGLLLLERRPGVEVRLIVDDGVEREVPFDLEARRTAKDTLEQIANSMPPAGRTSAMQLANPGQCCCGCPIRHVCSSYRANAPNWWKQYPSGVERLPIDVWGTALEVLGGGRLDLVLRDQAGRRVRVDGLEDRHGITPKVVGGRIWFFGLEATGATRGFDGARFHPRSFHELPRDRLERRAWSLQVFREIETSQ